MKKIFCCFVIAILSLFLTSAHAADEERLLLVNWSLSGDGGIAEYPGYSYAKEVSIRISNNCDPLSPSESCTTYFNGLTISQYASTIGVQLALNCAKGTIIDEIDIVSVFSKNNLAPLWRIKLRNVIISQIASAMNSTDGFLWEAIELSPAKIEWVFYTYNEKGAETGYSCTEWDRGSGAVYNCGE